MSLRRQSTCIAAILLSLAWASGGSAQNPRVEKSFDRYAQPGRLVRLPDGRRINLRCSGAGPITVVLEAGLGFPSYSWREVQPAVARFTRVCSYDRAGLGFSDPGPMPRTAAAITDDLARLIDQDSLRPPLVMVGSSMGGQSARLLAFRRPGQVAGIVLVDPYVEGESQRFATIVPSIADEALSAHRSDVECLTLLQRRALSVEQAEKRGCISGPLPLASPRLLRVIRSQRLNPATAATVYSEIISLESANDGEMIKARRPLGTIPILVLTAGGDFAEYGAQNAPRLLDIQRDGHRAMAALSSNGVERLVPDADHVIQASHPEAVIAAIREVLGCARRIASSKRPAGTQCPNSS